MYIFYTFYFHKHDFYSFSVFREELQGILTIYWLSYEEFYVYFQIISLKHFYIIYRKKQRILKDVKIQLMPILQIPSTSSIYSSQYNQFNKPRGNYYEHHNLPPGSFRKSATYSSGFREPYSPKKMGEIGRDLYPSLQKKKQDPGPGFYESPVKRAQSFGFISKLKPSVKLHRKVVQEQKLGPGYYNFENIASTGLLSSNKKAQNFKYNNQKKKQRLAFKIGNTPGPGRYSYEGNLTKTSNFSEPKSYKISSTKRSSILISNQNLSPGYYDWETFYKREKEKKKPIIEYKFIYGHPS